VGGSLRPETDWTFTATFTDSACRGFLYGIVDNSIACRGLISLLDRVVKNSDVQITTRFMRCLNSHIWLTLHKLLYVCDSATESSLYGRGCDVEGMAISLGGSPATVMLYTRRRV